jgi:expansin (peptidoglycan-binding protein)
MSARLRPSYVLVPFLAPLLVLLGACAAEPPPPPVAPPPAATPPASVPVVAEAPPVAAPAPPAVVAPAPTPAAAAPAAPAPAAPAAAPAKPAAVEHTGEAVFYDSKGSGACSLTFGHDAAVLSAPNVVYNKIEACGQCLEITGPGGTEVVEVVDRCNTCADDLLVINKPAFDKIAGKASGGREKIKWKQVPCGVTGTLELVIKKTSSAYWTAIQVRNHRLPVKSVALKKGDTWVEMTRSNDNYFVAEKGVGPAAFTIKITANDGQTVETTLDKWKDGQTYPTAGQFK